MLSPALAKGEENNAYAEMANVSQEMLGNQQNALNRLEISAEIRRLQILLVDLAASWLNEAEDNADASKVQLESLLRQIATFAPKDAEYITAKIDNIYNLSIEAVDAYVDGNRVMGNSLLAEARRDIVQVDEALLRIVELQILSAEEAKERVLDAIDVALMM